MPDSELEKDMEEARDFLLNLIKYPDEIDKVASELHLGLRERIRPKESVTFRQDY